MNRSQLFSYDFIFSVAIFLLIIGMFVFFWNHSRNEVREQDEIRSIRVAAMQAADTLIRTSGNPAGWNSTNALSIGLVTDENLLDDDRIEEFLKVEYSDSKEIMGLGNYDYDFKMLHKNGTVLELNGMNVTKGNFTSPDFDDAKIVTKVDRYGLLRDGQSAIITVRLVVFR